MGHLAVIIAACAVAVMALSDRFGRQAQHTYEDAIRQLSEQGLELTIASYQRGWFSSQAIATAQVRQRHLTVKQHIIHGPLTFAGGLRPVAAVIETRFEVPTDYAQLLSRIFGNLSVRIQTVVTLDGTFDTFISSPPATINVPEYGVQSNGFTYESYRSQDVHRLSGRGPDLSVTSRCTQAEVGGIAAGGESHLEEGVLRVGGSNLTVQRIEGSSTCQSGQPGSHGLVRDLSISVRSGVRNGQMDVDYKMSVASAVFGAFQMGPADLEFATNNIDANKFAEFIKESADIRKSKLDKNERMRLLTEKGHAFLIRLGSQSALSLGVHIASPDGATVGEANMGIVAEFAKDPRLNSLKEKTPDNKAVLMQLIQQYGYASGDLFVPQSFAARIASADNLRNWEKCGALRREGVNYVCRFSYKAGELLLNGNTF